MSIDEVSARIGRLEANVESVNIVLENRKKDAMGQHKELKELLQQTLEQAREINGKVKNAHNRIDEIEKEGGRLEKAHKNGEDWVKTKDRAKVIIATVMVLAGLSGFGISFGTAKLILNMFG